MARSGSAKSRHVKQDATGAQLPRDVGTSAPVSDVVMYDTAKVSLLVQLVDRRTSSSVIVDCSSWLVASELALTFAEASVAACAGQRLRTKEAHLHNLIYGFFSYLNHSESHRNLAVVDLTTTLLSEVVREWIGRTREDGSYHYNLDTRNHYLGALRKVIRHLKTHDRSSLPDDCEVPSNPWPGASNGSKAAKVRNQQDDTAFFRYCRDLAATQMEEVEAVWGSAEKALRLNPRIAENRLPSRARTVGMAFLRVAHLTGGYLPERKVLKKQAGELFDLTEEFGYKRIARALSPLAGDLTKFVFLVGFGTLLNTQPLLDLEIPDLEFKSVMGTGRLLIKGMKYRAGKIQRSSFSESNEPDSPYRLIAFVIRWTERLRDFCSKNLKNHLWLYVPRNKKGASGVETLHQMGRGKSIQFHSHLLGFCKAGGFRWRGLRSIREAGAELADQLYDGDIRQLGALLQHSGVSVTDRHYRYGAAQQRQTEQLVAGMMQRERWVFSDGRIDPRNAPVSDELAAATPGFRCLDPLDSPMRGERKGSLCGAYGQCPLCPLGSIDVRSPYALARLLQLKALHQTSREDLGEQAWGLRWHESYERLTKFWLPQFTDEAVLVEAERLLIPPLPPLD